MLPDPALVSKVEAAVRAMGPAKPIEPGVAMEAPRETVPPVPVCVRAPLKETAVPLENVKRLVFVTFSGPPPVVVTFPPKVTVEPVNTIPVPPVVDTAPLKVAVPVKPVAVSDPALIAEVVIVFALEIIRSLTGVVAPTADRKTGPVAAFKVKE